MALASNLLLSAALEQDPSICIVAGGEVVGAQGCGGGVEGAADCAGKVVDGAFGGLAQERL